MDRKMTSILAFILVSLVLFSKQQVDAQVDCSTIILKLINCESFLFGDLNVPSPQCCVGAQDLVRAATASKDVLKGTCRCLKAAAQELPVNFSNAARLTPLCHLNLNIPVDPSVDCEAL